MGSELMTYVIYAEVKHTQKTYVQNPKGKCV
jgi:hypothetical protein